MNRTKEHAQNNLPAPPSREAHSRVMQRMKSWNGKQKYKLESGRYSIHAHALRGFTLVEVVVALFILAVILSSSMRLFSAAVQSEQFIRDKTLANWVAQNHAVQLQVEDVWTPLGESSTEATMGGNTWVIHTNTTATGDESFRKIDIKIYKETLQKDYVAQLFSYSAKNIRW